MPTEVTLPPDYAVLLDDLKSRVRSTRLAAHRAVNTELLRLYWTIGDAILTRQEQAGWGAKIIDRLAADLRAEFPEMTGLSRANVYSMRAFAAAWPQDSIVQQPVGRLPWGHVTVLLQRLPDRPSRDWYAEQADVHGWSRNVLMHQIMNRLRERTGAAPTNFATHLPAADSELTQQLVKDPYVFDFLGLTRGVAERDLEQALTDRMVDTLRELGAGFAFVGRQVHFDVGGDDFSVDLLFFHVEQLRYVVVELKIGAFTPADAGQLGFYVAVVDDRLRRPQHRPTVGLLLCAGPSNVASVRYALGASAAPLAVSTFTYDTLPEDERAALPADTVVIAALGEAIRHEADLRAGDDAGAETED